MQACELPGMPILARGPMLPGTEAIQIVYLYWQIARKMFQIPIINTVRESVCAGKFAEMVFNNIQQGLLYNIQYT